MKIPTDQYLIINGYKTRYWKAGDHGTTIILIHGLAGCVEYWLDNITELAKNHQVYALDLIGFGRSAKPKISYSRKVITKFIKDFMCELKIKKANIIGQSLGGGVATCFAIDYPELVQKLILVSSGGYGKKIGWKLRWLSLPVVGEFALNYLLTPKTLAAAIRACAYNKPAISENFLHRYYPIVNDAENKKAILKITRRYINFFGVKAPMLKFIADHLAAINKETLIIWGKNDFLVPTAHSQLALSKIKNSQLYLFDKCGHIPQMEHKAEFNKLVLKFIS